MHAPCHACRPCTQEFNAFTEVVAGPSHSGGFPSLALDNSFGPEVRGLLHSSRLTR